MSNKIIEVGILFALFNGSMALAHGENKPGPHRGHIRMPGGFHTELVPVDGEFRVYLLDISFQNPTTTNSTVTAQLKQGPSVAEVACTAAQDFFSCQLPKGAKLESGLLEIKASRLGAPSVPAQYKLPLRFADIAH